MTVAEREGFLAGLHVGVLAVERDGEAPMAAPVWYRYAPGGDVELVTSSESVKAALLGVAGRASLCVQDERPPYRYVTVSGPVTLSPAAAADIVDLAVRYLGEAQGPAYAATLDGIDDTLVRLTPERWFTSDFSKLDTSG